MIAVLIIFTLFCFQGFPDMSKSLLSSMGLEQEDIDELLKQIGADQVLPEGCENMLILLQAHGDEIINNTLPQSTDQNARNLVTAEGHNPVTMYELMHNGDDYILVFTIDSYMCHIRGSVLCGCMDFSSFITISN